MSVAPQRGALPLVLVPRPWPTDGTVIHLADHPRSRHARHRFGNVLGNALGNALGTALHVLDDSLHDLDNALHDLDNALRDLDNALRDLDIALNVLSAPDNVLVALSAVLHLRTHVLPAPGNLAHGDRRIERSRMPPPSHRRLIL